MAAQSLDQNGSQQSHTAHKNLCTALLPEITPADCNNSGGATPQTSI